MKRVNQACSQLYQEEVYKLGKQRKQPDEEFWLKGFKFQSISNCSWFNKAAQ